MFEHLRRQREADVVAAQDRVAAAQAAVQQLQALAQEAADGSAAAAAARDRADQDAAAQQGAVNAARSALDAAGNAVSRAQQALDDHAAAEPDDLPNGKPAPGRGAWLAAQIRLANALRSAQAQLQSATTVRDQAVALAAQLAGTAATMAQQAAQAAQRSADAATAVGTSAAGIDLAAAELQQAQLSLAELSTTEARIRAEPLAVADLEGAADDQAAAALGLRHRRQDARVSRLAATTLGTAGLASLDAAVDTLAAAPGELRGLAPFAPYPDLAGVVAALDQLIADSLAQRSQPVLGRATDATADAGVLVDLATRLQNIGNSAHQERDRTRQVYTDASAKVQALKAEWD